jgi:putative NIF3 family GTP cyclohydrolase 1 type 2
MLRRQFVAASAGALGLTSFLKPGAGAHAIIADMTIQQVMDLIWKSVPGGPFTKDTVDTVKAGDPSQKVTGIVTTMFATVEVIRKAASLGANFIIAHEPTFYNHQDQTDWLEHDSVYTGKKQLLDKHKIVVWRFHDGIHAMRPDGVILGFLQKMGWEKRYDASNPIIVKLPPTPVSEVIRQAKAGLGIKTLRVVGDPAQVIERVAVLPGAWGGRNQIGALMREKPDLILCGEVSEWETAEYVRDARALGEKRMLVVLGHALSEEPGMDWMAPWLQPQLPEAVKVTHIASDEPFMWV